MRRLPVRVRLTAAFALATFAVLAGAGGFMFLRVRHELDDTIRDDLHSRALAVARLARHSDRPVKESGAAKLEDPEDDFIQLLAPGGRVLDSTANVPAHILTGSEARRGVHAAVSVERRAVGEHGDFRARAEPARGLTGPRIVVVGESLDDRDSLLTALARTFLFGGPIAVVAASILGYLLATAGLAPMEAMRRRASQVSLGPGGERLPLPAANDEVRRLGETLNDMLDRLERSFERERRFVADASHEIRTPVAIVKTEIEAALRSGGYGAHVREALVAAVDECDHLAQLAEDLLVIARAGGGELPVRREELDARAALDSTRERFGDRAREHGRAIRVEAPAGLRLAADPLRLRQALGNLADNALRHGAGEIVLSARASDGGTELDVADQGPGFASGIAEHAFERFSRGDPARTRGGAGLGMAIVRAIAEAHGGWSAIAAGPTTTVRLWLPNQGGPSHEDGGGRTAPEKAKAPPERGLPKPRAPESTPAAPISEA